MPASATPAAAVPAIQRIRRVAWLAAGLWTVVVGLSVYWNWRAEDEKTVELAYTEASASLNKDLALRQWMSSKGGLYARLSEVTQPSPYLTHLPDRDLLTRDGQTLTIINPALAIREVGARFAELYGTTVHITGNFHFLPENAPDAWERKALAVLEGGEREVSEIIERDGQRVLRLIRPLFMEPSCLKCHAITGIKVGELRGANGISVPLAPYEKIAASSVAGLLASHGAIWALGLGLLGYATHRGSRYEVQRSARESELRRLFRAVEQSASGILITDHNRVIVFVNPRFSEITGYAAAEAVGKKPSLLRSEETDPAIYQEIWDSLQAGRDWRGEIRNRKKSGESFWCQEAISAVHDEAGQATHFVAVIDDISERKAAEDTIRQLAYFDPLTNLPNRRQFHDYLQQHMAWSSRAGTRLALLYLDLDRFKTVNDTLGHLAGDDLLVAVGSRIAGSLREGDLVARLGGDEFGIVVTNVERNEDAAIVADKLLRLVAAPLPVRDRELIVSTSIGISIFPDDAGDLDDLVRTADLALYQAKAAGKNNYRFYTAETNVLTLERLTLENALRRAIDHGELRLEYQPQVDPASRRVRGIEALARWRHPTLGEISPATFIPLAEDIGIIDAIGEWVLATACRQLRAWEQDGGRKLVLAVNISALQLGRGDAFAATVERILRETGLAPEQLELEVTESALMRDPDTAARVLCRLKAQGVRIAIDDFGTGYSSLDQLRRLPVSALKIDRAFVAGLSDNAGDRAIVATVMALARTLGLEVVAEGVETDRQLAVIQAMGCDLVQGFLYSRPVAPDQLPATLARIEA